MIIYELDTKDAADEHASDEMIGMVAASCIFMQNPWHDVELVCEQPSVGGSVVSNTQINIKHLGQRENVSTKRKEIRNIASAEVLATGTGGITH